MKIVCRSTNSFALPLPQRGRLKDIDQNYPVTGGHEYQVLGMHLWENVLSLLVLDDRGLPCFVPAGLFALGDHVMPQHWKFGLKQGIQEEDGPGLWSNPLGAIWGYTELVSDEGHSDALLENDVGALAIFYSYLELPIDDE